MLLRDNAHPHAAARTQALLPKFGWEVFERPAYSPNLAPGDFHLFPALKEYLGSRCFKSDEEVKHAVREWLNELAAEVHDEGIQKLVTHYDKRLNVSGDYVEKITDSVIMIHQVFLNFYFFIFLIAKKVFTSWMALTYIHTYAIILEAGLV
jgi:histone-lysine N-methyltransferase SETMAR